MHAHQTSFAKGRALSASPSPPPIPPQPDFFEYKQTLSSFNVPPTPPRCYQLVPIGDSIANQKIAQQSLKFKSPISTSVDRRSFSRNNYENIRGAAKSTIVVKDPRRKPYYYNELNQALDIDRDEPDAIAKPNSIQFESEKDILSDEIKQNPAIRQNLDTNFGSGGSLDHVF